jgi:hypothetical protein
MREIPTQEAANDGLPPSERRLIEGANDAIVAIDQVVASAHKHLAVFDVNLHNRGFNSVKRFEALRTFLSRGRDQRLRIVVHDESRMVLENPRLMRLMRDYPMSVAIHRCSESLRHVMDPLVIADDHSFWHHLHVDHPRSVLEMYSISETAPWIGRFEEIWEMSEPAITPTTIGL